MSLTPDTPLPPRGDTSLRPIPMLIFGSRWLQLPLYVGLIVAQGVYVILFLKELLHLITHSFDFSEQQIMLVVLGLIDVVMISNLLVMVIVGGSSSPPSASPMSTGFQTGRCWRRTARAGMAARRDITGTDAATRKPSLRAKDEHGISPSSLIASEAKQSISDPQR